MILSFSLWIIWCCIAAFVSYICVCICMYIYMHVFICICMYEYVYVWAIWKRSFLMCYLIYWICHTKNFTKMRFMCVYIHIHIHIHIHDTSPKCNSCSCVYQYIFIHIPTTNAPEKKGESITVFIKVRREVDLVFFAPMFRAFCPFLRQKTNIEIVYVYYIIYNRAISTKPLEFRIRQRKSMHTCMHAYINT